MGDIDMLPTRGKAVYAHDETCTVCCRGVDTPIVEEKRTVTSVAPELDMEGWRRWFEGVVSTGIGRIAADRRGLLHFPNRIELSGGLSGIKEWTLADSQRNACHREDVRFGVRFPCPTAAIEREPGAEARPYTPPSASELQALVRPMVSLIEHTAIRPWFR